MLAGLVCSSSAIVASPSAFFAFGTDFAFGTASACSQAASVLLAVVDRKSRIRA